MRLRRLAVFGFAAVALSACGPSQSLDVTLQSEGSQIDFGRPAATAAPATPFPEVAANPFPNFPAPLEVAPPVVFVAPPTQPPNPCPTPPQIAIPQAAATGAPIAPPAAGTYAYRFDETITNHPGAANQSEMRVTGNGTRTVSTPVVDTSTNSYTFTVAQVFDGMTVANTYEVYPTGPAGTPIVPGQNLTPAAGMYLQQQVQTDSTGKDTFTPSPPILLMPFPADGTTAAAPWEGSGTDPSDEKTEAIDPPGGTITGKALVNACGSVLDSYQSQIPGHVSDARQPSAPITFLLTLDVGTEYGGLPLEDTLTMNGVNGGTQDYTITAIINQVPAGAASG